MHMNNYNRVILSAPYSPACVNNAKKKKILYHHMIDFLIFFFEQPSHLLNLLGLLSCKRERIV